MSITVKVGGRPLADLHRLQKTLRYIKGNPDRTHVVVSALGSRDDSDMKITDQLLSLEHPQHRVETLGAIKGRHLDLAHSLGIIEQVQPIVDSEIERIFLALERPWNRGTREFVASRGEYLSIPLVAIPLGYTMLDAKDHVRFNTRGEYDPRGWGAELPPGSVLGGFSGRDQHGRIRLLPRNGSDITGAQVALSTGARLYEVAKDVPGIHPANPKLVTLARGRVIKCLGRSQAQEITYRGEPVIHDQAIAVLRDTRTAIRIFDILSEDKDKEPGTYIYPDDHRDVISGPPLLGIGERDGFTMFVIECPGMNTSRTFTWKLATALKDLGISYDHIVTGTNVLSLVVRNEEFWKHEPRAVAYKIRRACRARVSVVSGLASICVIGNRLGAHPNKVGALLSALGSITNTATDGSTPIRVHFYEQGGSGTNLVIGVKSDRLQEALQLLYRSMYSVR